jgi:hypothetical protein
MYRQDDVLLVAVDDVPDGTPALADGGTVAPGDAFVRVDGRPVTLVSAEAGPVTVTVGAYRVLRQRDWSPPDPAEPPPPSPLLDADLGEALAAGVTRALSTHPADRGAAERAVTALYEVHGLPAPEFVWADSPLGGMLAQLDLPAGTVPDPGDRDGPSSVPALVRQLHGVPGLGVPAAARAWLWAKRYDLRPPVEVEQVCGSRIPGRLRRRIETHVMDHWPLPWMIADRCGEVLDGRRLRAPMLPTMLGDVLRLHGQFAVWLEVLDACRRAGLTRYPAPATAVLDPLLAAARACGTWWPAGRVCVMVDRPSRLEVEFPRPGYARAHAADGPALAWRDGWELHAWRGTSVPPRVVHGDVNPGAWVSESRESVHRAMAERLGYGWALGEAAAYGAADATVDRPERVATDEHGTLWRIGDILVVEEHRSGRAGLRARRVPPDQTVPRDAVGWTFGLGPGEYR